MDVSSQGVEIDAGRRTAQLQAQLGGWSNQGDNASVKAEFLSSAGAVLGSISVSPVAGTNQMFQLETASGTVPAGTRSIKVTMTSVYVAGVTNDGYLDNLFLELRANEATPTSTPTNTPIPTATPAPTATPTSTPTRTPTPAPTYTLTLSAEPPNGGIVMTPSWTTTLYGTPVTTYATPPAERSMPSPRTQSYQAGT